MAVSVAFGSAMFQKNGIREPVSGSTVARLPQFFMKCLQTEQLKRRLFNCSVCKHFMKNWGNLATVDPDTGSLIPFFWNIAEPNATETAMVPPYYHDAVEGIAKLFVGKKVKDEFK